MSPECRRDSGASSDRACEPAPFWDPSTSAASELQVVLWEAR